MRIETIISILIAALVAASLPAMAQRPALPPTAEDGAPISSLTAAEISQSLEQLGVKAELTRASNNDPVLRVQLVASRPTAVRLSNCRGERCAGIYLSTSAPKRADGPTLAQVNRWNSDKRWSRSYIAASGEAVLESELLLAEGVSRASVRVLLERHREQIAEWLKELGY